MAIDMMICVENAELALALPWLGKNSDLGNCTLSAFVLVFFSNDTYLF